MSMLIRSTSLPVERTADLVVVGASCGGAALAYAVARAGHSVVLVEPRTYPGYEVTATLRPWIMQASAEYPPVMQPWLSTGSRETRPGELALHPDAMKRGLEDALLSAGVHLYYASQPCGLVYEGERLAGVVIGNKSGRQAILARTLVDATEWATLLQLSGTPLKHLSLPATIEMRRTLEFINVAEDLTDELHVSETFGVLQNCIRVHRGYSGAHHVLLECPFRLELVTADIHGRMALEIEVRRRTMDLAAHLLTQHSAFQKADLAQGAWELWLPTPWRMETPGSSQNTFEIESEGGKQTLSAGAFIASTHPNLFVLNTAVALTDATDATIMLEPLAVAQVGTALAPVVEQVMLTLPLPVAEDCTIRCGTPKDDDGDRAIMVREPEAPQRGRNYPHVTTSTEELPCLADVDVLVVGGGTSGVPAAAVAASGGMKTAILEMNAGLGGTGTLGGVSSYWYGRRIGFTAEIDTRYAANASRFNVASDTARWNMEVRIHTLVDWASSAGAAIFFRTQVVAALLQGNRVCGVVVATPDGLSIVRAQVVIDASGDGDVAAFAGARYVYGSSRDRLPLWYSLAQFVQPGRTRNNFTSSVDVSNINDYTRAILAGRRRDTSYDHGSYIAPRESRHIVGEVVHTLTDQLTLRRFPDVINICFSNYDVKGKSAADWVLWGLLPPNVESEIAYRAVVPADLDGILVTGKAFSSTHDALSAIRMQPDLQNLGGACAVAATLAIEQGVALRHVTITRLQQRLIAYGILPPEVLTRTITPPEPTDEELAALVDGLTGEEPFYIDMDFDDVQREPMTLVTVCTAGPRIVPLLTEAYATSSGERQLLLARILAWYGSDVGVPCLLDSVEELLSGEHLPPRTKKIRHAGFPPDQGAMPEVCYLLYTLGMTRDARVLPILENVVSLLEPTPENFRDRIKGTFYYVDAICYIAERLGSPAAIPHLLALYRKEGLHGLSTTSHQADYFDERIAYLEVVIGRALARCGSSEGMRILISYLDDARVLLAEHAQDELMAVSGQDWGKDKATWTAWLETNGNTLQPQPWLQRID